MSDIEDLEARIAGALERIRAGVENLSAIPAIASEPEGESLEARVDQLTAMLEDEQRNATTAQAKLDAMMLKSGSATEALEARIATLTAELDGLEQENAQLLALNQVRLNPKLTKVTGVVMADSGSPFRQSVLLNVGSRDGIKDGWATMDGLGVVGRISGVGKSTARVILLTDPGSNIPVTIQPSGQRGILKGDNAFDPMLSFVETPELVRPGDRVVSSGDGGVFPADLLVGQVTQTRDGILRVRLAADLQRLHFLKVLRSPPAPEVEDDGTLIAPEKLSEGPEPELEVPTDG